MSTASRVRKSSPVKQGPMRATIPMSSLLRHSTGLQKSPTLSPTSAWRTRTSPESSTSGQRSPGSITYKAKSKTLNGSGGPGSIIRRTASLDTIYLKGQWPRDNFYLHTGLLQVDKATQTEDPSSLLKSHRSLNVEQQQSPSSVSSSFSDDKLEKLFRQRLQRPSKDGGCSTNRLYGLVPQMSIDSATDCTNSGVYHTPISSNSVLPSPTATITKASPVNIPVIKPMIKPPMRNSIEGLNQEIERLVLKAGLSLTSSNSMDRNEMDKYQQQATPEGHRAPLADLLRSTRSVNTQTPAASDMTGSCQSSGPPSRDSVSPPLIPGQLDASRPNSAQGGGSSPEDNENQYGPSRFSTSPHINRFLAREPPDGCERVHLRFHEDTENNTNAVTLKPCVTFQLRPSLGSAFQPLKTMPEYDDNFNNKENTKETISDDDNNKQQQTTSNNSSNSNSFNNSNTYQYHHQFNNPTVFVTMPMMAATTTITTTMLSSPSTITTTATGVPLLDGRVDDVNELSADATVAAAMPIVPEQDIV